LPVEAERVVVGHDQPHLSGDLVGKLADPRSRRFVTGVALAGIARFARGVERPFQ
jgi:hypothetical protein